MIEATAKELMDHENDLKSKKANKKTNVSKTIRTEHLEMNKFNKKYNK